MKTREFKRLALLGLTSGLFVANADIEGMNQQTNKSPTTSDVSSKDNSDPNSSNVGYHVLSEDEFLIELNEQGIKMYKSLNPEAKKLAVEVASMRCVATNPCAGLNACASEKNDCAGQSKCKGQGKCAVSDKNLAVKLVYNKMANKRAESLKN
jgi:hypothetical protein